MSENFETFLRFWVGENIRPLDQTDSSDLHEIVRTRAKELTSAATTAGFYGERDEAAHPYGGIEGLVRDKFEQAIKRAWLKTPYCCLPNDRRWTFSRANSRCKIKLTAGCIPRTIMELSWPKFH